LPMMVVHHTQKGTTLNPPQPIQQVEEIKKINTLPFSLNF
jgi:hypothetical protein